ncbi:MAG: DUF2807 domain-containing protein [Chloroflexi bacterium]|nr:DUF2807 domain-containing protein [Chloroflexota bacterium]
MNACTTARGSGNVVIEERDMQNFTRVMISGQGKLLLSQGETESLRIEAEDNIIPLIETTVSDDTLFIKGEGAGTAVTTLPIEIHLTIKNITSLESSGISRISGENIVADQLQLIGSDYGKIEISALTANKIIIHLREDGNVELEGEAQEQEIDVADHANYRGAKLKSQITAVSVSGSGTATVWVTENLNGIVNQNGDVLYYGSPNTDLIVVDSGKVKNQEE